MFAVVYAPCPNSSLALHCLPPPPPPNPNHPQLARMHGSRSHRAAGTAAACSATYGELEVKDEHVLLLGCCLLMLGPHLFKVLWVFVWGGGGGRQAGERSAAKAEGGDRGVPCKERWAACVGNARVVCVSVAAAAAASLSGCARSQLPLPASLAAMRTRMLLLLLLLACLAVADEQV